MQVSERDNQYLHHKLPIDADEKILGVYRHHWFAYASSWIVGLVVVIIIMALAIGLTAVGGSDSGLTEHRSTIIAAAAGFSVLVLLGTCVPVYLRSQEQLVLTEEALLQVLRPSLFASKVDQVNLQRLDDVSVRQDFFGTMFGYGHITVETPGEQDNYEFFTLPSPHQIAKEIVSAHENYNAALQAGRLHTTLGEVSQAAAPAIDPEQYQQFLEYQRMVAQQKQEAQSGRQADGGEQPPAPSS